jgi:hypothetical protein
VNQSRGIAAVRPSVHADPAAGAHWLPRRTGTVVMLTVLALLDVLAVLVMLTLLAALAVIAMPSIANAQSLNPPIAIFTGRANGTIVLANPTLYPVNFVLEPFSYVTTSSGDLSFLPLDTARIHLSLSSMSGRIPPRQAMRLFYEARADSLPSWFAIIASFSRGAPAGGLSVRLQMSQMVYLMQPEPVVAADLSLDSVTFDARTRLVHGHIRNHSGKLTRLLTLSLVSSTGSTFDIDAGPIYPNSVHDVVYAWTRPGIPVELIAAFEGFSLSQSIR